MSFRSTDRDHADVVDHEVVGCVELMHESSNFFEGVREDLLEGAFEKEADEIVAGSRSWILAFVDVDGAGEAGTRDVPSIERKKAKHFDDLVVGGDDVRSWVDVFTKAFLNGVDAVWAMMNDDDLASGVDDTRQGIEPILDVVEHVTGEDEIVVLVSNVRGRASIEEPDLEVGCGSDRPAKLVELSLVGIDAGVVDLKTHGQKYLDEPQAHVSESAAEVEDPDWAVRDLGKGEAWKMVVQPVLEQYLFAGDPKPRLVGEFFRCVGTVGSADVD